MKEVEQFFSTFLEPEEFFGVRFIKEAFNLIEKLHKINSLCRPYRRKMQISKTFNPLIYVNLQLYFPHSFIHTSIHIYDQENCHRFAYVINILEKR